MAINRRKRCVSSIRIPLCPPELKSLYFERNAEIQAFLLPTENSFNCKNAVACEKKTSVFHTNSHEIHTAIGGINVTKEASSRQGAVVFVSNKFIASTRTIWSSGSSRA